MENTRKETKYNKVVNFEDGEISVLEYTFENGDFKGAVGIRFIPIAKEEYEEKMSDFDGLVEYLMDTSELPDRFKEYGYRGWAEAIVENDEVREVWWDTSYSYLWDSLREQTGLSKDEAYIFDCIGGGRMFNNDFQGNVNPELSAIIREYETK